MIVYINFYECTYEFKNTILRIQNKATPSIETQDQQKNLCEIKVKIIKLVKIIK